MDWFSGNVYYICCVPVRLKMYEARRTRSAWLHKPMAVGSNDPQGRDVDDEHQELFLSIHAKRVFKGLGDQASHGRMSTQGDLSVASKPSCKIRVTPRSTRYLALACVEEYIKCR